MDELAYLKAGQTVLICCDSNAAALLARTLCTFANDTITMHAQILMPSDARPNKDGYALLAHDIELHVVHMNTEAELPPLQLPLVSEATTTMHLFEEDSSTIHTLQAQLEEAFGVTCRQVFIVEGWLQLQLRAGKHGDVHAASHHLRSLHPNSLENGTVADHIIRQLETAGKTITFAESCTGGLLSYYLTQQSGASGIFEGALITYSNRLKSAWIAVEASALKQHGAVSETVVAAMSEGALAVSDADYAIAVSGIAGPTGGTPVKPVGTVYVSVRSKTAQKTLRLQLSGDRRYVQELTVLHAIKTLLLLDKKTFFAHGTENP